MKTVECFCRTFNVPEWANYVAVDCDGSVWAYEGRPDRKYFYDGDRDWYNTSGDNFDHIESVELSPNAGDIPLYEIPKEEVAEFNSEYINVMIDLETLGRSAGCSIMSIGAVEFDVTPFNKVLGEEFYVSICRDSCDQAGLFEDQETLDWWDQQSAEARAVFTETKVSLGAALVLLSDWLATLGPRENLRIWGNGAAFDNAILIYLYRIMGIKLPWNYDGDMCFRTLKSLVPDQPYERIGEYHNALDDAKTQAYRVHKILKALKNA